MRLSGKVSSRESRRLWVRSPAGSDQRLSEWEPLPYFIWAVDGNALRVGIGGVRSPKDSPACHLRPDESNTENQFSIFLDVTIAGTVTFNRLGSKMYSNVAFPVSTATPRMIINHLIRSISTEGDFNTLAKHWSLICESFQV